MRITFLRFHSYCVASWPSALVSRFTFFVFFCSHKYNRLASFIGKSSYRRLLLRHITYYIGDPPPKKKTTRGGKGETTKVGVIAQVEQYAFQFSTVATIPSSQIRKDHSENWSLWIELVAVFGLILPDEKNFTSRCLISFSCLSFSFCLATATQDLFCLLALPKRKWEK